MREGFDLPPLMFTRDEIVALVAGARMVRALQSGPEGSDGPGPDRANEEISA